MVSVLPARLARGLRLDLPRTIAALNVPVRTVISEGLAQELVAEFDEWLGVSGAAGTPDNTRGM
jgi:hypothetical protein